MGKLKVTSSEAMRWVNQAVVTLNDGRTVPVGYLSDDEGPELDSLVVYGAGVPESVENEIKDILAELGADANNDW
jgi:hypothetical protein